MVFFMRKQNGQSTCSNMIMMPVLPSFFALVNSLLKSPIFKSKKYCSASRVSAKHVPVQSMNNKPATKIFMALPCQIHLNHTSARLPELCAGYTRWRTGGSRHKHPAQSPEFAQE